MSIPNDKFRENLKARGKAEAQRQQFRFASSELALIFQTAGELHPLRLCVIIYAGH